MQQLKCAAGPNNGISTVWATFPSDSEIVFSSNELAWAVPGTDHENDMVTANWLGSAFLCWARILCSQYSIDREPTSSLIAPANWERTAAIEIPSVPIEATATACVTGLGWETAITPSDVTQAVQLLNKGRLAPSPLHHMMSAIDSIMADDFQSGYVLAATAVESYVSNILHQAYETRKNEPENLSMRFVTIKVNKSKTVKKDPIWECLNEGRPDFKLLLHEKPLYLGLPSVRILDKPLYDRVLKLYKTRNDLVHEGVWSRDSKSYSPNRTDGLEALQAVVDVIKIYGGPEIRVPKFDLQIAKIKTAGLKLRHLDV